MRQIFVPALLLATAALSSSNVLPMMSTNQQLDGIGIDSQQNDNIFSNSYNPRDFLNNILYTVPIGTLQSNRHISKPYKDNRADFTDLLIKGNKYDDEGYRKEQWHNYPRQLDRLQKYLLERHMIKREPDNTEYQQPDADDSSNEFLPDNSDDSQTSYNSIASDDSPLMIFKIRLANLKGDDRTGTKYSDLSSLSELENGNEERIFGNEISPPTKVKREEASSQDPEMSEDNSNAGDTKTVNKRLFSLWSRLQSLSPKGHEISHRRYLHSLYGLPEGEDGGGNEVLKTKTRAMFSRPPGSPLRWG